jgi:DNA processing protein
VSDDAERLARVALSFLANPGDPVLGAALRTRTASALLAAITGSDADGQALLVGRHPDPALAQAIKRWRARLARGVAALRLSCINSVSIVGSRAATGYGSHVAIELAANLAERGVAIVSGGAYGIDASAHRGALAVEGVTAAVQAGGLEFGYPRGHGELFAAIAAHGVLISECPPERGPTRPGFLVRNRIIAALTRGTVVVEAALRSGALNTARHARELCRPVMAVPGPVTSEQSAGCHELIREYGAMCVTCGTDVAEHIALPGTSAGPRRGPNRARDVLDPAAAAVLEEVPVRGGRGPASIAARAGVDLDTALRCLGLLAIDGFVERNELGWRAVKLN